MEDTALREHVIDLLAWKEAHAGFEAAVAGMPARLAGRRPEGFAHSAWELLEHLHLSQRDILEFCVDPAYQEKRWPDDYWPAGAEPPSADAWDESVRAFRFDREALGRLASDGAVDLFSPIPHGTGQTYLRELLLVADHNAYHVGQLVMLRRLLGAWP